MSDSTQKSALLEQLEENLVKLTLTIEAAPFEDALNRAYLKNRGKISLPGFRKGRAPRKMIEMQFGKEVFYEDALDFAFPDAFEAAIKEHGLDVVSAPSVDIEGGEDGGAIIYAEVYTKPVVEIEDYAGIEYTQPDVEVADEEVNAEIDREREKNSRIHSVTDRAAEDSDIVVIDFEGFVDDVAFPGGSAEKFELTLGSKSFIPGFEDQIIGKNIGDAFDVDVTFPEEYHAEELAGKPAVFKVVLHEIKHKEVPEADDSFAQEVSEFDTLDEYKADIKAKIAKRKADMADRDIENQLLKGLSERISLDVPKPMIDTESDRILRDFANRVQSQGMDFGRYMEMMGMDVNGLRAMYAEQAKQNVLSRLALEAIIKKEGLEASEEEYEQELDRLSEAYSIEKDKLVETIGEDEKEAIKEDVKAKKALDMIKAAAVAVEKKDEEEASEENDES
ncbi:MAG: trigger factor [Defluviitaleaceae bacterium]|nr:trigger factor [Defluviitaleaceae bacterium]